MEESPVTLFRRSFDEKLAAAGVVCSAVLGIGLNQVTWASPGESILVALSGTTLAFVVGAALRAERRAELRGLAESAPELERLAALTAEVTARYPSPVVRSEVDAAWQRLGDDLHELSRGRQSTTTGESRPFLERTARCTRRMRAVTNIAEVGPEWWAAPVGRDYWQANLEAIRYRNVKITRIFIVADRAEPGLTALLAEQRAATVDVLVLDLEAVPKRLQVNLVVWDDDQAWEGEMGPFGGVRRDVFHHDPREVRRLSDLANACRQLAGR
jgi:hypothetical protein